MKIALPILFLFGFGLASAQVGGERIYNFLNIPTSAAQAALGGETLTIKDDGRGMTEEAVRAEYLNIASYKRKRTGELSPNFKRKIKGRKGIGKFAGLAVAQVMTIETTVNGMTSKL